MIHILEQMTLEEMLIINCDKNEVERETQSQHDVHVTRGQLLSMSI